MNGMMHRLYSWLHKEPLRRKVLITPTHAMGHQWLERISRELGPVMNTEVETVASFVGKQAQLGLFQAGYKPLRPQAGFWIVRRLMAELSRRLPDAYVQESLLSPGVVHRFYQALDSLRQAGVKSEQLEAGMFASSGKGAYIQALLASYEQELARLRAVDLAGLVSFVAPLSVPVTLIVPETLELTHMQEEALRRCGFADLVPIESEASFTDEVSGIPASDCVMFHATGPMVEVREVLRRIGEQRIALDEVEIIASDYAVYAPALYTQIEQLGLDAGFTGGVPISYSSAARTVRLYLDWIDSGYAVDRLTRGLRQGLIRLEGISLSKAVKRLETSGIGWGRERYEAWLTREQTAVEQTTEDDEEESANEALRAFIRALLSWSPTGEVCTPYALFHGALKLVEGYAPLPGEEERTVAARMKQLLEDYPRDQELETGLAIRFVVQDLESCSVWADPMPKPGRLLVSSLRDGGCSGRAHTFIVGMSEQAWSDAVRQDPVLLDEEREAISPQLVTSKQAAQRREKERSVRLALIRGKCTLSFSSFDLTSNKEVHPAYELLQLYRRQSGEPAADFERLMTSLGPISGYIASPSRMLLDAGDTWLASLGDGQGRLRRAREALYADYAHLRDGHAAAMLRAAQPLSIHEGLIDTSSFPIAYDEARGQALSVSRMEQYARCPLQYFYAHVLKVRPKETAELDRSRWLDAMQRGSLLHEVFQQYYERLHSRGNVPGVHDRALLDQAAEETLASYAERIPAPSVHIREKERLSILRDVDVFWKSEQEHGQQPLFMELALHDEDAPFLVELGEELTLPLRGLVDRIDPVGPGRYRIYDYKTGKHKKYKAQEYFAGGTQLQHAVYAAAVEQWLQRRGEEPDARVVESAYYFPTETGLGEMVVRNQDRRDDLHAIISSMLDAMGQGLFPPTKEPAICAWCDYKAVCGTLALDTQDKRETEDNLLRLRRLEEVLGHD